MHGIAILVGVLPAKVRLVLQSLDYFRELVPTIIKIVYVRIRISAPNIRLDQDDWYPDQDVCTALIACSTLTPQQVSRYENDFGAGAALLGGAAMALWLSGAELPERMSHESVFDVADFMTQTSTELTEKIKFCLEQLQCCTENRKKRRRLNNSIHQVNAVCQGRIKHVASPEDLVPTGSWLERSAATGETASTPWPTVGSWLLSGRIQDINSVCTVKPGLCDQEQSLRAALKKLCDQLLSKAWEETRLTQDARIRFGNLEPCDSQDTISKIFMPRDPSAYSRSKECDKQRLVWIASLHLLRQRFKDAERRQRDNFDVEACGVWAFVVSHSADQISVAPKVSDLPCASAQSSRVSSDTPNRVCLIFGPDLHCYVHIYDALRNALMREEKNQAALGLASCDNADELRMAGLGTDPQEPEGTVVMRALLGLKIPKISRACPVKIPEHCLDDAEKLLGVSFSEFQRTCILGIKKRITHWSFVAGAGKTKMLVALALIETWLHPDRLVCLCAGTNAIAADLEETLRKAMDLVN